LEYTSSDLFKNTFASYSTKTQYFIIYNMYKKKAGLLCMARPNLNAGLGTRYNLTCIHIQYPDSGGSTAASNKHSPSVVSYTLGVEYIL